MGKEDPKYPGTELGLRYEDKKVTAVQPVHVGYYSRVNGWLYSLDGVRVNEDGQPVGDDGVVIEAEKPAKTKSPKSGGEAS